MSAAANPDEQIVKVRATVKEDKHVFLLVQPKRNHAWVRRSDCRRIIRRIGDSIVIEMLAQAAIDYGLDSEPVK